MIVSIPAKSRPRYFASFQSRPNPGHEKMKTKIPGPGPGQIQPIPAPAPAKFLPRSATGCRRRRALWRYSGFSSRGLKHVPSSHNAGRKWVIGGVARGSGECFLAECPNNKRDADTLCLLILQFVRPGTTIITDKWKGYLPVEHHGYTHYEAGTS